MASAGTPAASLPTIRVRIADRGSGASDHQSLAQLLYLDQPSASRPSPNRRELDVSDLRPAWDVADVEFTAVRGDETGRALEVLAVLLEDGQLVIHAMDLRAKYCSIYDAAKEATTE